MATRGKARLREFWTPDIGVIVFWIASFTFLVAAGFAFAQRQWLTAFLFLGGILAARIALETTLVLFQIHDVLVEIRDQGSQSARPAPERPRPPPRPTISNPGETRLETM